MKIINIRGIFLSVFVLSLAQSAAADSVANFYKGKTITLAVPDGPGGKVLSYARLIQNNLQRYIPGNPTIALQLRPGRGGLRSLGQLAEVAPRDGTHLGIITPAQVSRIALSPKSSNIDLKKFSWIGKFAAVNYSNLYITPSVDDTTLSLLVLPLSIGLSVIAPPGVPKDRIAAISVALRKMQNDPSTISYGKKYKLPILPSPVIDPSIQLKRIVKLIMSLAYQTDVVRKAKKYLSTFNKPFNMAFGNRNLGILSTDVKGCTKKTCTLETVEDCDSSTPPKCTKKTTTVCKYTC